MSSPFAAPQKLKFLQWGKWNLVTVLAIFLVVSKMTRIFRYLLMDNRERGSELLIELKVHEEYRGVLNRNLFFITVRY